MHHGPRLVRIILVVAFTACLVGAGLTAATHPQARARAAALRLNDLEYLEMAGLNVMLAHDYYPEGHQGGVGIIQNGLRVATNGDIRLDRTPGQWQPIPKVGRRIVDRATQEISVHAEYPDESRNRKGFNPIEYPDLRLSYTVRVRPEGAAFRILVDLDAPLPDQWADRVGFNLELFPGILFGKTFQADSGSGVFPLQPNGPGRLDERGEYQPDPMATGRRLVIAAESDRQRMTIEDRAGAGLELVDGRGQHTNGWFVVRSRVARGRTRGAVDWLVSPHAIAGWVSPPVVQVSQVGYHPKQQKWAVIELDRADTRRPPVVVSRISDTGALETVLQKQAAAWGRFLRFDYLRLDFSQIDRPGMYVVRFGDVTSDPFPVAPDVFGRGVWQPTLEYFLPVQMCHMRVNDRYRVWHDACHLDDARMAPTGYNHIDGYAQGPSTLTRFESGQHVPGLDRGGWHDAGDDDLRIESQADTVYGLALAYEAFHPAYDNTTIDQSRRLVEIQRPDGKPDFLQQIQHGVLTVAGSYNALGRFYRGMIVPTLRQYRQVGDFAAQTDHVVFDPQAAGGAPEVGTGIAGSPDDRWVFTEQNPRRELSAAAALAAASRVLRGYDDALAGTCLRIAETIYKGTSDQTPAPGLKPGSPASDQAARPRPSAKIGLAVELLLATRDRRYAAYLVEQTDAIVRGMRETGWVVGRALPLVNDAAFTRAVTDAARAYRADVAQLEAKTPYGVPYEPAIWGAGWGIQRFGMQQYFLHAAFPDIFPRESILHALDFVLGCHPGPNTASFVSGVGARSVRVGYGLNRADWSYIPGGSVSGTALIRPDFPELLEWPFLWQQTEYVLGGGTTDYLILALAADHLFNDESSRAEARNLRTSVPVGVFESHADVGPVKIPGSASYDAAAQEYVLQASGTNMWAGSDEFHFAWKKVAGDFILQARVEFVGKGVEPHRKLGLMVRSSLEAASPHVNVSRHGDGLTSLQFRRAAGADTEEIRSELSGPDVLQLERKGDTYTMSVARFGEPFSSRQLAGVKLGDEAYVGIYLCAHNPDVSEKAILRNVRLIRPAKDDFRPYRDYIGSDVEVLDVQTGVRRTVHHVDDSMQAPNWTPDGRRLILNRNGRIYAFDLASKAIGAIDTDAVTSNNNDHALSFDGTMLGLSAGQPSVIFTVPVGGGTPKQITPVGPSYLHGWSPDGRFLVFTGQRNNPPALARESRELRRGHAEAAPSLTGAAEAGDFDIYRVPSAGGPEQRLTTTPGLDDGSEFTPDGKWIYFNSSRTGRMQVWRMRPDGSGQEQLTFDDFNNWFPHVSPDGKSVVFITYGPDIAADDHPWYKRVYIRKMPIDGGRPSVVAYLYGGQGSMNVNSWSPDSRSIAFVSNSGL